MVPGTVHFLFDLGAGAGYQPLTLGQQVSILYAGVNGFLDDVPVEKVQSFERAFHEFMAGGQADVLNEITTSGNLTDEVEAKLKSAITDFKGSVAY